MLWGQEDSPLWTRKNCPHPILLAPWSKTSSLKNGEKQMRVVYKPPSLWYFITAAWTHHGSIEKKKQIIRWSFCTYAKLCMCVYEKWIKRWSRIWCCSCSARMSDPLQPPKHLVSCLQHRHFWREKARKQACKTPWLPVLTTLLSASAALGEALRLHLQPRRWMVVFSSLCPSGSDEGQAWAKSSYWP